MQVLLTELSELSLYQPVKGAVGFKDLYKQTKYDLVKV